MTLNIPRDIDHECIALFIAMNSFPGIRTVESCCGHNERPFRIFFTAESLENLPPLVYWFDSCHSGVKGWSVIAHTDCGMSPITFIAEGPVGDYEGADKIAAAMMEETAEKFF